MQRTRLFSDDNDDLFIEERNYKQIENFYLKSKIILILITISFIIFLVYLVF